MRLSPYLKKLREGRYPGLLAGVANRCVKSRKSSRRFGESCVRRWKRKRGEQWRRSELGWCVGGRRNFGHLCGVTRSSGQENQSLTTSPVFFARQICPQRRSSLVRELAGDGILIARSCRQLGRSSSALLSACRTKPIPQSRNPPWAYRGEQPRWMRTRASLSSSIVFLLTKRGLLVKQRAAPRTTCQTLLGRQPTTTQGITTIIIDPTLHPKV